MNTHLSPSSRMPPKLATSIDVAQAFCLSHGRAEGQRAVNVFAHQKRVLDEAERVQIVERDIIDNSTDIPRAWINSDIAEIILYHSLRPDKFPGLFELPAPLQLERLRREISCFDMLVQLDRDPRSMEDKIKDYGGWLKINGMGRPPLALQARLADYAVSHGTDSHLQDFVYGGDSVFRTYPREEDARTSAESEAVAGERIYAPIAELFSYLSLAAQILEHAYSVNYPHIYAYVNDFLSNSITQSQIEFTQREATRVCESIQSTFRSIGIEAELSLRPIKSKGKAMRKVKRKLEEEYLVLAERDSRIRDISIEEYIRRNLERFDMRARFSDLIAVRLIVDAVKIGGERIVLSQLTDDLQTILMQAAKSAIETHLRILSVQTLGFTYMHEYKKRENGYATDHYDVKYAHPQGTNWEIQLRTRAQNERAEGGLAAHDLYVGAHAELRTVLVEQYGNIFDLKVSKLDETPRPPQTR